MRIDLRHGDCVEVMKTLADASVDAVVTDPPYELGFMGKGWDASGIAYSVEMWREVLRVLKPGGHLLAFGGTRTYHRMAVAIEDAGFEIRDSLHWIYGSGFPKSLDVSKAIDKAAGAEREKSEGGNTACPDFPDACKGHPTANGSLGGGVMRHAHPTTPATNAAKQWSGWGTALKPAHEPVVVARKPLAGTVAANVQTHGTGALNIDGCRVEGAPRNPGFKAPSSSGIWGGADNTALVGYESPSGRWPPNILLSHTPECGETCAEDCAVAEMDRQSGISRPKPQRQGRMGGSRNGLGMGRGGDAIGIWPQDVGGGASRFFPVFRYQAKASRSERERGLNKGQKASHPCVKPLALMRWLVRLVTPPGGVVLEPFMGSGTTGVACVQEGFGFVGIEREAEYFEICKARIAAAQAESPAQKELFSA